MRINKLTKILTVIIVVFTLCTGILLYFMIKQNIDINNLELKMKEQNIEILKIKDFNKTLRLKIKYLQYMEYFKHNNEEPVILYGTNSYSYWESILLIENNLKNEKTKMD